MPFSDVHLQLHSIRAVELRAEAAAYSRRAPSPARPGRLRTRLGWLMIECGLRLVNLPSRARLRPV